jgi:transposase
MEDRALRQEGCDDLKGTRYAWLSNHGPAVIRMSDDDFSRLRRIAQKTARAWAMKETARAIWDCRRRWEAEAMWKKLIGWMKRSRLEPMQKLATTIKTHLRGILNAAVYAVSNAFAESINAKIQKIKKRACGFRSRDRYIDTIYFHLGGLDLRPERLTYTS